MNDENISDDHISQAMLRFIGGSFVVLFFAIFLFLGPLLDQEEKLARKAKDFVSARCVVTDQGALLPVVTFDEGSFQSRGLTLATPNFVDALGSKGQTLEGFLAYLDGNVVKSADASTLKLVECPAIQKQLSQPHRLAQPN